QDRVLRWKTDGTPRRSAQTVLHQVAVDLLRLLAPVMSFTADEAWQLLPGDKAESVFLAGMPEAGRFQPAAGVMERYQKLFAVRAAVLPLLEAARRDKLIGASLEAKVSLVAQGAAKAVLEANRAERPGV